MADTRIALLPDRGVVSVTGEDAGKLLQGVVTNDMGLLEAQPAIHTGLLTPQGKILFDFFVVRTPDGFLLETARDKAAGSGRAAHALQAARQGRHPRCVFGLFASLRFGAENTSRTAPARHRSCSPIRGCRRSVRASS